MEGVSPDEMRRGKVRPGYRFCGAHIIFEIKIDGKLTWKERLVTDDCKAKTPFSITNSSRVSTDSVRIALTVTSLNELDICACDTGNAYLSTICREKMWTVAGLEFGSEKGSAMLIERALYGLFLPHW